MYSVSVSKEKSPIISIVIPTYNRAGLIRETLDSIKVQTSPNWECLVVDDGSSDETESIVGEYVAQDARFSFHKRDRDPKGAPTCRNIGLSRAKGDWLVFLDSDDLLVPNRIEKSLDHIHGNPSVELFVFRLKHFGGIAQKTATEIDPVAVKDDLKLFLDGKCSWITASPTWKKKFVEKIGGWREGLEKWQDWEFHVRALLHSPRLYKTSDIGYYQRISISYNRISTKNTDHLFFSSFALASKNLIQIAIDEKVDRSYLKNIYKNFFFCLRQISKHGQTHQAFKLLENARISQLAPISMLLWSCIDILKTSILIKISLTFKKWANDPFFGFPNL